MRSRVPDAAQREEVLGRARIQDAKSAVAWAAAQQRTAKERCAASGGTRLPYADFLFCRFLTRSSTTPGSAKVEVSPKLPGSSSAILRRMRRMILPERVLGRPGENWIWSGAAIGPISLRTQ